jgi:hypothetical protein
MHDVLSRLGLSAINPGAWTSAAPLATSGERETLGSENPGDRRDARAHRARHESKISTP